MYTSKKVRGFTLIELVIVIVILSIIARIASLPVLQGFVAYNTASNSIDADWQARYVLQRMSRDLQGASNISTATSNTLSFTDTNLNAVTYSLSGTQLQRTGLAVQPFAYNVSNITFTYFNNAGASLAAPVTGTNLVLISYITISITISENGAVYTAALSICPRNFT